jgi:hypothetical protein
MNDREFELLVKRMDDHREESQRQFNELSKDLAEMKDDIKSISQWRWKLGGIGVAFGIILSLIFETSRMIIDKMK